MSGYLEAQPGALPERLVLLRHDVENDPAHAARMAGLEADAGLRASYFFRAKRGRYTPETLRRISGLGHEIGYHYESVSQAWGDVPRALELFALGLAELRAHASVRVASMHGSPLYPWDNRAIWSGARPADFGLLGETYLDIDYARLAYYTDTGRSWHPTRFNIRDRTAVLPLHVFDTTDELLALLENGGLQRLCLLTHPERWSASFGGWCLRGVRDGLENATKLAIARVYRLRRP